MQKSNNLVWVLAILVALVALSLGAVFSPFKEIQSVDKPYPVPAECPVQEAQPLVCPEVNVSQTVVADASEYQSQALAAWEKKLDENDDWITCDDYLYDESDMSYKVLSWHPEFGRDSEEYDVYLELRQTFKDGSDDKACKVTRNFVVHFEQGERPDVELIE